MSPTENIKSEHVRAIVHFDTAGAMRQNSFPRSVERCELSITNCIIEVKKVKGSPYSITERRVPELIPILGVSLQVA